MPLKFPLLPIIVIRSDVDLSLHIWKSSKMILDFLDLHTTRRVIEDWPLVRQGLRLFFPRNLQQKWKQSLLGNPWDKNAKTRTKLSSSQGKQDPGLQKTVLVPAQWTVAEIRVISLFPHTSICNYLCDWK